MEVGDSAIEAFAGAVGGVSAATAEAGADRGVPGIDQDDPIPQQGLEAESLRTMRVLGENLAWLLKTIAV
jgi:hypothetical protein